MTDPGTRRAVSLLADNFDRLGRAAVTPRTKKMVNKGENRNWRFLALVAHDNTKYPSGGGEGWASTEGF